MPGFLETIGVKVAAWSVRPAIRVLRKLGRWQHGKDLGPQEGDRFNILVADLQNDGGQKYTRHLVHSLERYKSIRPVGLGQTLKLEDLGDRLSGRAAAEQIGRTWLFDKNCDVLIWGELTESNQKQVVRLRFLGRSGDGGNVRPYSLNDQLELPSEFDADLANLVAAQVFSAVTPATGSQGKFIARSLEGSMEKIAQFVGNPVSGLGDVAQANLRLSAANAAIALGKQTGSRKALLRAIEWCRLVESSAANLTKEMVARATVTRAISLQTLGEREEGTDRLEEAVSAYRAALEVRTRTDLPLDWAMTQNNLGAALQTLGEREEGTDRLEEAVGAYRAALEVYTRTDLPLDWARTQNNLGAALQTLGGREEGTDRLEEAVGAYRAALEVRTRTDLPLDWARTQNNLGAALQTLGGREEGTDRLEEAVGAYRAALEVRTRTDLPLDWAMTQNNLGNALATLGEREEGTDRLEEAVGAYRAALEVRTRTDLPLDWAMTQNNLGNALRNLGEREEGTDRLEEAVGAYRAALEVYTRTDLPLLWAATQNNLGTALRNLGEREEGTDRLEEAVKACRAALEVRTRTDLPLDWAMTQNNLGNALSTLGEREEGTAQLEEAVGAYRGALEVFGTAAPHHAGVAQRNLDRCLQLIGERKV